MSEPQLGEGSLIGIAFGVIVALIAVVYGLLRRDDNRNAKNIHELRNTVQQLAVQLASIMRRSK